MAKRANYVLKVLCYYKEYLQIGNLLLQLNQQIELPKFVVAHYLLLRAKRTPPHRCTDTSKRRGKIQYGDVLRDDTTNYKMFRWSMRFEGLQID